MEILKARFEIIDEINGDAILKKIEKCGRVCYKSEKKIDTGTAKDFVQDIINRGHESVLEHVSVTVRVICDRGVSHEIVRHRIASYSQESTRYCNYGKEESVKFIRPLWFGDDDTYIGNVTIEKDGKNENIVVNSALNEPLSRIPYKGDDVDRWVNAMCDAERHYLQLVKDGWSPQKARSVLPNSTKTEIIMTMNLREWRHFFKLRAISTAAHPQMREIAIPLLLEMQSLIPIMFDDLRVRYEAVK